MGTLSRAGVATTIRPKYPRFDAPARSTQPGGGVIDPTLLFSCCSDWGEDWVVSDCNVIRSQSEGRHRVLICGEDGGDFPGDWDDLRVSVEWVVSGTAQGPSRWVRPAEGPSRRGLGPPPAGRSPGSDP